MTTVMVSGWKVGFQKVQFTELLQTALDYPLSRAKRMTDAVLEAGTVEFQVPDGEADRIASAMDRLGAKCTAAVHSR